MDDGNGPASGMEAVFKVDEAKIRGHVDQVVRESVEETLAIWQDIERRAGNRMGNWRFQMHLFRAYLDAYIRRKLLEDKSIDAIVTATPNHWHALLTVWACQAGKDVYVEKPMSHNVFEGRKCVEAAAKYGRIVQATHGPRGGGVTEEAFEFVKAVVVGRRHHRILS